MAVIGTVTSVATSSAIIQAWCRNSLQNAATSKSQDAGVGFGDDRDQITVYDQRLGFSSSTIAAKATVWVVYDQEEVRWIQRR